MHGAFSGMVHHLEKILERDPNGSKAQAMYRELTGVDWSGERRRGRGKHHRRR